MTDAPLKWLEYATENLESAELLLDHGLLKPCLQNSQQAVEKALKAIAISQSLPLIRTHSIAELRSQIQGEGVEVQLGDDDVELLDSVYLPSRYPLGGALPDAEPDVDVCQLCINIAQKIVSTAESTLAG
jgi:HEPN domain-containing protein